MHNPVLLHSGIRAESPLVVNSAAPRVLVVDDEPAIARVVTMLLSRSGFAVETFTASTEALARLCADPAAFEIGRAHV